MAHAAQDLVQQVGRINREVGPFDLLLQVGHQLRRQEMRRHARRRHIRALQPRARQRQPCAQRAGQAWQEPATADIRKQADPRFRHGKHGPLSRHSVRPMHRQAHTAAHRHTVHDRQNGLRERLQRRVHAVFDIEKGPRLMCVARPAFGQHANVPARAEAPRAFLMLDHDEMNGRIAGPSLQGRQYALAHRGVQRLQG